MDTLTTRFDRTPPSVLLVSSDRGSAIVLRAMLEQLGASVRVAPDAAAARAMLDRGTTWVVMDPSLEGDERAGLIQFARALRSPAEFVVMAEMRDIEGVLEVMGYSMAG